MEQTRPQGLNTNQTDQTQINTLQFRSKPKTRTLLTEIKQIKRNVKKSKLSKPMQLEKIVEEEVNKWEQLSQVPRTRVDY